MTDEWRPVVGYEGLYEVSASGAVRGLDRQVPHTRTTLYAVKGRVLQACLSGPMQYLAVTLCSSGKPRKRQIHHLVLEAFVSPRPPGMYALHRDGDHHNNDVSNLYWGTSYENYLDAMRHGTHVTVTRTLKPECKWGHEFTPENTAWRRETERVCRECDRARGRVRDRKKSEAKAKASR